MLWKYCGHSTSLSYVLPYISNDISGHCREGEQSSNVAIGISWQAFTCFTLFFSHHLFKHHKLTKVSTINLWVNMEVYCGIMHMLNKFGSIKNAKIHETSLANHYFYWLSPQQSNVTFWGAWKSKLSSIQYLSKSHHLKPKQEPSSEFLSLIWILR